VDVYSTELIRDIDQKYKYGMKHRAYDFLKSSIWKDWGGDLGIVKTHPLD
jgi:hypothetical protein